MLECAIPEHLRRERTCPVSTPLNYQPPFPGYCARFPTQMKNLVMGIIGAQYVSPSDREISSVHVIENFMTSASKEVQPSYSELISVTDKRGAYNIAVLAYWPSTDVYERWEVECGFKSWWQSPERETDRHGWFQEILRPTVDRFETVFSNNGNPEGAANMQGTISDEMQEHAYWGSMRDRLAAAQDDRLEGEKCHVVNVGPVKSLEGIASKRIHVPGKRNLCVIRSGQDWSDTLPAERKLYLETMHPVLIEGMNFLRDEGREIGCYANNLWDVIDLKTHEASLERTFGLGFFDDLKSLECWSKSHQTHINIFGGFLTYAKKLNNVLSLRLFHEIYVLEADQQHFEYIGCHDEMGMLNVLRRT